jgi:peptidoglycan hydrolase-like amidase/peptidoglycan hydrolase CwlO-like protein
MKIFRSIGIAVFLVIAVMAAPIRIYAESCDFSCTKDDEQCFARKLTECNKDLENISNALRPNVAALQQMEKNIAAFDMQLTSIAADLVRQAAAIKVEEGNLQNAMALVGRRIAALYRRSQTYNPLLPFLTSTNVGTVLREFTYQQLVINRDKKAIAQTAVSIQDLQERKAKLEAKQANIASLKTELDVRAASVRKLVAEATAYQNKLKNVIAQLSAAQQAFLANKLSGLNIPLFAISGGGCSSDLTNGKNPGFSGGFGFFSYGVPNRVGLNQYGAWGRAKAGQNYDTILHAYYNFDEYKDFDVTIKVNNGNGINQGSVIWSGSLDDYVKRVYEVPDSWTDNDAAALKAQAIAVRSYALAATNKGGDSICATQSCQVFKTDPKGGNWEGAVNATSKKAMVQGGNPIKAFFSSTHGGYIFGTGDLQGWSPTSYTKRGVDAAGSIGGFGDLQSHAYDHESPWFYCDWGGRSQYGGTAWLKSEEVADIVNVIMLAQKDGSAQSHLTQTDKPNPDGTDTWDAATVRSKLGSGAYTSVSGISVSADFGSGRTTSVTVNGDAGSQTINGNDFKTYFNLRAPSNIQIVGPLFNIERH